MKKIIVIDNYDSFTYNLVHYLEDLNCEVSVFRNDEFELEDLKSFDKILLSPGPGVPDEAGLLKEVKLSSLPFPMLYLTHQVCCKPLVARFLLLNRLQFLHQLESAIDDFCSKKNELLLRD